MAPYQPLSSLSGLSFPLRDTRPSFPQQDIPDTTGSKINLSKFSISPMGAPAASPDHNVTPKPNTIAQKQVKPPTAPSQINPPPTPVSNQSSNSIGSFPGLMGSLANTSIGGNQNSNTAQQDLLNQAQNRNPAEPAISGLYGLAQKPNEQVTKTQEDYNKFAQENPYMRAAQYNPNVAADIASGRDQVLGQTFAAELGAKQAAVGNALTGQEQQISAGQIAGGLGLTGQAQQISALEQAGGLANTAQGQRIQGLTSATGFSAPQSLPLTSQPYYPVEGQFGGAGGNVGQRATQAANISSLSGLVDKSNNYHANFGGIENLQNQLTNFLGVKELNPTTFPYVNQAISTLLTRGVGDPNYQQLQNYMSDLASRYASYFGNDAAPTNQVRNVANSLINGNAKPSDIVQVIQGLSTQAGGVMQGIDNQIQYIQNNPTGINAQQGSQQPSGSLYDW